MTTRREFVRNFALAGIGLPMVTGLFPNPPNDCFSSYNWNDIKTGAFYFLGVSETPIQAGEKVKDLVQYPSHVLQKEGQTDGCTVVVGGDTFVVVDGHYCLLNVFAKGDEP